MTNWAGPRHPVPAFLFVLPLLVAYEIGVLAFGGPQSAALRNGADAWVRELLAGISPPLALAAPVLIGCTLAVWAWRRLHDAPDDAPQLLPAMALESVAFALILWGLSRLYAPLLEKLGLPLSAGDSNPPSRFGQAITYLGAGIYEEVLFRFLLFAGLVLFLQGISVPGPTAVVLAALMAALLFAVAHHLGPRGEKPDGFVFVFRTLAGLYFTLVYHYRGLGVAVGAHACYDVLVGLNYE